MLAWTGFAILSVAGLVCFAEKLEQLGFTGGVFSHHRLSEVM